MEETEKERIEIIKKANEKRRTKTSVFYIVLICAIVALIVANIGIYSYAYYYDSATNNSSLIVLGSVSLTAKIDGTENPTLTLDSNILMAGEVTAKDLDLTVTGENDCYIRIKGVFSLKNTADDNYVSRSDLVSFAVDGTATDWVNSGDYYYYKSSLAGKNGGTNGATLNDISLKFTVSTDVGNEGANSEQYTNRQYKIVVTVESCQAYASELGSGDTFNPANWKSN